MSTLTKPGQAAHPTALARTGVIAAGAVVALLGWVVANAAVADLGQPAFGTAQPQALGAGTVIAASLVAGLLGWASLIAVEHFTTRGASLWVWIATAAALLSLGGPLSGEGVTTANRVALVLLHAAVALVVIPLMFKTSRPSQTTPSGGR